MGKPGSAVRVRSQPCAPNFRLQRIGALIEFVDNGLISPFANELPSEPSVFLQLFCNLGTPYVTDRLRPQPRGANGVSLAERSLDAFAEAAISERQCQRQ